MAHRNVVAAPVHHPAMLPLHCSIPKGMHCLFGWRKKRKVNPVGGLSPAAVMGSLHPEFGKFLAIGDRTGTIRHFRLMYTLRTNGRHHRIIKLRWHV